VQTEHGWAEHVADELRKEQTMSDVVQQARELLAGITPGEWAARDGFIYPLSIRYGLGSIRDQDAEFIAAAPRLVADLADEVERLRAALSLIQEGRVDYDAALSRREHGAVAADRFMRTVFSALDDMEADHG
jgi:hypothetical protein